MTCRIYGGSEEHNISSDLSYDDIPLMEDHVQGKDIRRHHCTFPLIMKTLVDNGQVNSEHSMWDLNLVSKKHETSAQMWISNHSTLKIMPCIYSFAPCTTLIFPWTWSRNIVILLSSVSLHIVARQACSATWMMTVLATPARKVLCVTQTLSTEMPFAHVALASLAHLAAKI